VKPKHRCAFEPPSRVWEQSPSGLWYSRRWKRDERARYKRDVLGQPPKQEDLESTAQVE
jgi:hypothetical protein